MAGRGGGAAGADGDVGAGLEHGRAGGFEAFGSKFLCLADEERAASGFGRWGRGSALGLAAVAAEGFVVDVIDAAGSFAALAVV